MPSLYACLRTPTSPAVAAAVAQEFSPRLQRYGRDSVVLDVGGLGRLLGDPRAIGEALASRLAAHETRIRNSSDGTRITRITSGLSQGVMRSADLHAADPRRLVSAEADEPFAFRQTNERSARSASRESNPRAGVAVAPTQAGAMMLSSAYLGLTVVTGDVASALAPIRLEVLRQVCAEIHGAAISSDEEPRRSASRGPHPRSARSASRDTDRRFEILDRWGLTTLGEVAALPAEALSARLGQMGITLQRLARGVDVSPLVPDPDVPRFLERIELEWPIDGLEPLAFVLARLLEPLSLALERADRAAAAIHLRLRLVDRREHARLLQLPAALRDPKVLRTLLVLDLESHPPPAAIDIVTIEIDPAPGRVLQYSLLERARPSAETLATLMARLGALVGESRSGQAVLLDSHGPDAFEMRRFAPDDVSSASLSSACVTSACVASACVTSGCVASAFRRKDPQLEPAVLRRFRPPIAVRVTVDRGRPAYVCIDRRGLPGGAVEQCAGPWRSSGAWWKEPAARPSSGVSRPWNRDEWDVALSDGSVCRLFRARDSEHWFLDGVVD